MRLLRHLFYFTVFSNLFIAGCAILMAWQTGELFLNGHLPASLLPFIFFASICSYSFHWYLTEDDGTAAPRMSWLRKYRRLHLAFFTAGTAGALYYGIHLWQHWGWLLLTAFITFLYSAPKIPLPAFRWLRRIAIGKTIFLALVWMHVTTTLPLAIADTRWETSHVLFALSRFFLIYAICILFDYRDREHDRQLGIRSLITWLSEKAIVRLFALSIVVFFVSTLLLALYGFSALTIGLLAIPGLIVLLLYPYASTHFSDTLYYFLLDGLMAFSALLSWLWQL